MKCSELFILRKLVVVISTKNAFGLNKKAGFELASIIR